MSEVWYYAREGKPKGPVNREEIENLLRDGTLTPETLVWREGTPDWVAARTFFSTDADAPADSVDALAASVPRGASLDIVSCLQEARRRFKLHWGVLIVGWLVAQVVIPMVVVGLFVVGYIAVEGLPVVGKAPVMTPARLAFDAGCRIVAYLVNTPLQAGFFLLCLQALRGQPNLGVVFDPFRKCWVPLILATLAMFAITVGVLAVPVGGLVWAVASKSWVVAAVLAVLAVALGIYLSLCSLFIPALVADAGQKPLQALASSFRMVYSQLIQIFGLAAVCLGINLLGLLCCGVGLIVTVPLTSVILMAAYQRLVDTQG